MEVVKEFRFTQEAEQSASSVATMTLYQVLLGRDPENSYVVEENKTQPIGALFRSFIRSPEFTEFVLSPLERKARLRHELTSPAPTASQREWLMSLLVMSPTQRVAIMAAPSWRGFFCALLGLPSDGEADDVPRQIAGQKGVMPPEHPVSLPEVATSALDVRAAALEEISAIELRLDRLKALVHAMGEGAPH